MQCPEDLMYCPEVSPRLFELLLTTAGGSNEKSRQIEGIIWLLKHRAKLLKLHPKWNEILREVYDRHRRFSSCPTEIGGSAVSSSSLFSPLSHQSTSPPSDDCRTGEELPPLQLKLPRNFPSPRIGYLSSSQIADTVRRGPGTPAALLRLEQASHEAPPPFPDVLTPTSDVSDAGGSDTDSIPACEAHAGEYVGGGSGVPRLTHSESLVLVRRNAGQAHLHSAVSTIGLRAEDDLSPTLGCGSAPGLNDTAVPDDEEAQEPRSAESAHFQRTSSSTRSSSLSTGHAAVLIGTKEQTRWHLRCPTIVRRYSGDATYWASRFDRKQHAVRQRFARRRSVGNEVLAETQRQQLSYLVEVQSASHRSSYRSPGGSGRTLHQRQQQQTLALMHEALEVAARGDCCRRSPHRSSRYDARLNPSVEIWPESVTGLLTNWQLLIDRSILLTQLPQQSFDDGHTLKLAAAGATLPRYDKVTGEDSFFICGDKVVGVADGVGEWADFGCNAKNFADELMQGAESYAKKHVAAVCKDNVDTSQCSTGLTRPAAKALQCLIEGFAATKSFGSSTCLIAWLDGAKRQLGLANLGDSTAIVFRRNANSCTPRMFSALRRTREQQHFFNCPFQLSRFPLPSDVSALEAGGFSELARVVGTTRSDSKLEGDTPAMADLYDVKVLPGDLLILGTDGIFDNLFDQEVASLVSFAISPAEATRMNSLYCCANVWHPNSTLPPLITKQYGIATPPEAVAKALAAAAFHRSQDTRARTPFGRQSRRAGTPFNGGKLDDITVVAAWIV